ncbi:hypothetical protein ABEF95_016452 [Exophiala dermatitidis]
MSGYYGRSPRSEQSSSRNPDREREGQRRDDHRKREEEEHDRDEYDHETRYDPEREQRLNDAYDNFKTEYVREQKFKYLWPEKGASAEQRTASYRDRAGWSEPLDRILEDRVDRFACSDDNRRTMDTNPENRITARDFAYNADDRRSRTYEDPRRSYTPRTSLDDDPSRASGSSKDKKGKRRA